jgi:hypothetical protein
MLPKAAARHSNENRYCQQCKSTTSHSVKNSSYACQRCGSVKHPTRQYPKVEDRIAAALGLLSEESDTPHEYEVEGEHMTSAEGAHRPDKGTKFVQLKYDDQFEHKEDYYTLHH